MSFNLPRTRNWNAPALDTYARACLLRPDAGLGDVINHSRGCLSYLATPYSKLARDDDGAFSSAGSLECAARAARWARLLALEGITAVSPIIQAVEMVHVNPGRKRGDTVVVQAGTTATPGDDRLTSSDIMEWGRGESKEGGQGTVMEE